MQYKGAVRILDVEDGIDRVGDEEKADENLHPCLVPIDKWINERSGVEIMIVAYFLYV